MLRRVNLSIVSFTKYPMLDGDGNIIPWYSIDELDEFLKTEPTDVQLGNYLLRAHKVIIPDSYPDKDRPIMLPVNSIGVRTWLIEKHLDVNPVIGSLMKYANQIMLVRSANPVFEWTGVRPGFEVGLTADKYTCQIDSSGTIAPFTLDKNQVAFTKDIGKMPKEYDEISCDYLANPYLFGNIISEDALLSLFTIRVGKLPVTVLAKSKDAIYDLAKAYNVKLLPVTMDSNHSVIPKSQNHIYTVLSSNEWNKLATDAVYRELYKGYQYMASSVGTTYEFSSLFGFGISPVKQLLNFDEYVSADQ